MGNETQTKVCKHCQTEIPKKAKVCPNCRKKQGGILKWIIIAILAIAVISSVAGGDDEKESASDSNPQKVEETVKDNNDKEEATEEPVDNTFAVGEILETSNLKISYLSAEQYVSDNQFIQPAEGNVFYRMEFEFENVGDSDEFVTSASFECYADGYSAEQSYYGDDALSADLSPGKKAKGAVYFEVPADATEVTLEYELNYWTEDKVIFVVK